jgi:hypothetical protein
MLHAQFCQTRGDGVGVLRRCVPPPSVLRLGTHPPAVFAQLAAGCRLRAGHNRHFFSGANSPGTTWRPLGGLVGIKTGIPSLQLHSSPQSPTWRCPWDFNPRGKGQGHAPPERLLGSATGHAPPSLACLECLGYEKIQSPASPDMEGVGYPPPGTPLSRHPVEGDATANWIPKARARTRWLGSK